MDKFFDEASSYKDGVNKDGSFKPVTSCLFEFFDAAIIVLVKYEKKEPLKTLLDKGWEFAYNRMPSAKRPNHLLESELTEKNKEFFLSVVNDCPVYKGFKVAFSTTS